MSKMSLNSPSYSPGVLSLLPLYYVGWADSVLSPSEIKLIKNKINDLPFLTKKDKEVLKKWSNPSQPPTSEEFKQWVAILKKSANDLPSNQRHSLANLGMEMAKRTASGDEILQWNSAKTKAALEDLENALGIESFQTFRNIFTQEQREREVADILNQPGFDIEKMTKLLDDEYSQIRTRMRTLLKDPIFKLQTLREKDDYRNKVLEWCTMLAK